MSKQDIVIPIITPVGVRKDGFLHAMESALHQFKYKLIKIKITDIMIEYEKQANNNESKLERIRNERKSEFERITAFINAGDEFRKILGDGGALAYFAIKKIMETRLLEKENGFGLAFVIDSLKHPSELKTIKMTYGNYCLPISLFDTPENRKRDLIDKFYAVSHDKSQATAEAQQLIDRDFKEEANSLGQKVSDLFHDADVFLKTDSETDLFRILKAWFDDPSSTPKMTEYGMQIAASTARCSGDLSRQVGSAIISPNGDVVSTGFNEVPHGHGLPYWPELFKDSDYRDRTKGEDSNFKHKSQAIHEFIVKLQEIEGCSIPVSATNPKDLLKELLLKNPDLKNSRIFNLIEFGSVVHAEMNAIMSATRRGVPLTGCTMICTTFPCHMCAKHIISSGINRLIYLEPYQKSMADVLYFDQITTDNSNPADGKVLFEQFVGVGPKRYMEFFNIRNIERKNSDTGEVLRVQPMDLEPRYSSFGYDIEAFEQAAMSNYRALVDRTSSRV